MSYVTAVDCVVVDPTAVGPSTDAGPPAADGGCEDVDAPVTESGTGTISSANDKGCVDVDASAVQSCPFVADKGCEDVDGSIVQSCKGTNTCLPFADKWEGGAASLGGATSLGGAASLGGSASLGGVTSLDRAESGKSADWSKGSESCGGDPSRPGGDNGYGYCRGVVTVFASSAITSLPVSCTSSGSTGTANTRLRAKSARRV